MYSGVAGFGWNVNVLTMWSFFLANSLFLGLGTWVRRYLAQSRAQSDASSGVKAVDAVADAPAAALEGVAVAVAVGGGAADVVPK
jgi:hypothetical protein